MGYGGLSSQPRALTPPGDRTPQDAQREGDGADDGRVHGEVGVIDRGAVDGYKGGGCCDGEHGVNVPTQVTTLVVAMQSIDIGNKRPYSSG